MTIRRILRFPHPGLRRHAEAVVTFDASLVELAADLLDTMRDAPGIGITAPHLDVPLRLFVLELPDGGDPEHYVNPEIIEASAELARHEEGSVSMPGVTAEVERPARVVVRCQDLAGAFRTVEADGLRAVCIQHEIEQLNGVFWIQRLSRLKRERVVKRFEKISRGVPA